MDVLKAFRVPPAPAAIKTKGEYEAYERLKMFNCVCIMQQYRQVVVHDRPRIAPAGAP